MRRMNSASLYYRHREERKRGERPWRKKRMAIDENRISSRRFFCYWFSTSLLLLLISISAPYLADRRRACPASHAQVSDRTGLSYIGEYRTCENSSPADHFACAASAGQKKSFRMILLALWNWIRMRVVTTGIYSGPVATSISGRPSRSELNSCKRHRTF